MIEGLDLRQYREIPGFDGHYIVDRMANVYSLRDLGNNKKRREYGLQYKHIIKAREHRRPNGSTKEVIVTLNRNRKNVSVNVFKIMKMAWFGDVGEGQMFYHKNGDLRDNCLNNIAYGDPKKIRKTVNKKPSRRPVAKINKYFQRVEFYPSIKEAAKCNYVSDEFVKRRAEKRTVKDEFYFLDGYSFRYDE